jgi:hypothetical protein
MYNVCPDLPKKQEEHVSGRIVFCQAVEDLQYFLPILTIECPTCQTERKTWTRTWLKMETVMMMIGMISHRHDLEATFVQKTCNCKTVKTFRVPYLRHPILPRQAPRQIYMPRISKMNPPPIVVLSGMFHYAPLCIWPDCVGMNSITFKGIVQSRDRTRISRVILDSDWSAICWNYYDLVHKGEVLGKYGRIQKVIIARRFDAAIENRCKRCKIQFCLYANSFRLIGPASRTEIELYNRTNVYDDYPRILVLNS